MFFIKTQLLKVNPQVLYLSDLLRLVELKINGNYPENQEHFNIKISALTTNRVKTQRNPGKSMFLCIWQRVSYTTFLLYTFSSHNF